jgi:excinuclease UvrABC ATPase subunit
VFGTIAAESQRLINETYSAFLQSFMAAPSRPDVEGLRNLSTAIVVDQERMGANSRSTVGTATDAHTMLRIVFSRIGEPHVGPSTAFSFNLPDGMCPECEGIGKVNSIDVDQLADKDLSLREGAITVPNFTVDSRVHRPGGHVQPVPVVPGRAAERGGAVVADQRPEHRGPQRHADQRPGRVRPRGRRAGGRAAAEDAR